MTHGCSIIVRKVANFTMLFTTIRLSVCAQSHKISLNEGDSENRPTLLCNCLSTEVELTLKFWLAERKGSSCFNESPIFYNELGVGESRSSKVVEQRAVKKWQPIKLRDAPLLWRDFTEGRPLCHFTIDQLKQSTISRLLEEINFNLSYFGISSLTVL